MIEDIEIEEDRYMPITVVAGNIQDDNMRENWRDMSLKENFTRLSAKL